MKPLTRAEQIELARLKKQYDAWEAHRWNKLLGACQRLIEKYGLPQSSGDLASCLSASADHIADALEAYRNFPGAAEPPQTPEQRVAAAELEVLERRVDQMTGASNAKGD